MKRTYVIGIALAFGMLLSQGVATADSFTSRAAWEAAMSPEPFFDVNLGGAPNSLSVSDTLAANAPILLPPNFIATLAFDTDLAVEDGTGTWTDHIGGTTPLVLRTNEQSLVGTFSSGIRAFGFAVLVDAVSTLTVTLNLTNGTQYVLPNTATGAPQFYGWIYPRNGSRVAGFELASTVGGITVGNFVVPEGRTPIWLSGLGLLVLVVAAGRKRFAL